MTSNLDWFLQSVNVQLTEVTSLYPIVSTITASLCQAESASLYLYHEHQKKVYGYNPEEGNETAITDPTLLEAVRNGHVVRMKGNDQVLSFSHSNQC